MPDKEYVCAYPHCLHPDQSVDESESVVIGKKHYHWDCASLKQEIQDSARTYAEIVGDKTRYPAAIRIINTLVFKNCVPIDYVRKIISISGRYYKDKPVYALYGIRSMFWEKENKV